MNPITQKDIKVLTQSIIQTSIELRFVDDKSKVYEAIEGQVLSGSLTVDSESNVRRTLSLELYVDKKAFTISEDNTLFITKYVDVIYKMKYIPTDELLEYHIGQFLFTNMSIQYNATTHSLSVSCSDRMANFNGDRAGTLRMLSTLIEEGSDKRNALVSLMDKHDVSKYIIEIKPWGNVAQYDEYEWDKIPYDLQFSVGDSAWSIVEKFLEVTPGHEAFFDLDTFIFRQIPTGDAEMVQANDDILQPLVISESPVSDITQIKNSIEIWGASLESDYYTSNCVSSGSRYSLGIPQFKSYSDTSENSIKNGVIISFKADRSNQANSTIKINTLPEYPIVDANGAGLPANTMTKDVSYVLKFQNSKFYYMGMYQIHSIIKLVSQEPTPSQKEQDKIENGCSSIYYQVNPQSPFTIEKIGEIRKPLYGGVYENITSEDLAMQRGRHELYKCARLTDGLTLTLVYVPWLDVNRKIEYTSNSSGVKKQYLIKNITTSFTSGDCSMSLISYYPDYPFI